MLFCCNGRCVLFCFEEHKDSVLVPAIVSMPCVSYICTILFQLFELRLSFRVSSNSSQWLLSHEVLFSKVPPSQHSKIIHSQALLPQLQGVAAAAAGGKVRAAVPAPAVNAAAAMAPAAALVLPH